MNHKINAVCLSKKKRKRKDKCSVNEVEKLLGVLCDRSIPIKLRRKELWC